VVASSPDSQVAWAEAADVSMLLLSEMMVQPLRSVRQ
jgi:hypothetical protein